MNINFVPIQSLAIAALGNLLLYSVQTGVFVSSLVGKKQKW